MSNTTPDNIVVVDVTTRAISIPESEVNFGVAGDKNVETKHICINGHVTASGLDLSKILFGASLVTMAAAGRSPTPSTSPRLHLMVALKWTGHPAPPQWRAKASCISMCAVSKLMTAACHCMNGTAKWARVLPRKTPKPR